MADIGPVQMITIAFGPDAQFDGRVIDELTKLEQERTIRVLDLLFVLKDPDGSGDLVVLDHQGEDLGGIVGALLGVDVDDVAPGAALDGDAGRHAFGLTQADVEAVADGLDPGYSAGFLLIEHLWAKDLKRALREVGGIPVAEGFLTPELVRQVEPELAARVDALNELEAEGAS